MIERGSLGIDELVEEAFAEDEVVFEQLGGRERRAELGNVVARDDADIVPALLDLSDDNVDVDEGGPDGGGAEGRGVLVLEDDGDDVVADVTLALHRLGVVGEEGHQGGHVEDDLEGGRVGGGGGGGGGG